MNPNDVAQAAIAKAELLHGLQTMIMTDPEVIRANNEALNLRLAPEFAGNGRDDYAQVFWQAAILRTQLKLEPRPVLKQDAVDGDRARWGERERSHSAKADNARTKEKLP
jgi:hypothetical protein